MSLVPLGGREQSPFEQFGIALADAGVEFVVIGGYAAMLLGSYRTPSDIDLCQHLTPPNQARLATVLTRFELWTQPPPGEPDLTLCLSAGQRAELATRPRISVTLYNDAWVDFVGDLPLVGDYSHLRQHAEPVSLAGRSILVQGLDDQIRCLAQLADPRRADLLSQLEAIRRIRGNG